MDTLLSMLHIIAWCIYVGGAICMELVLSHAQKFMKPSQTAVVCERSGQRYRWVSLACLLVLLATGWALALRSPEGFDPVSDRGRAILVLQLLWLLQLGLLTLLTFRFHPDMHARLVTTMTVDEMKVERQRVGVAIVRMNRTVKIELGVALVTVLVGASVHLFS